MSDDSLQCILGRVLQSIEDLKVDVADIKQEQSRQGSYIDTQKIGVRLLIGAATTLGVLFVYFKEHLEAAIFGKVPH